MARKDRTGNRKTREQRKQFKVPELGYYLIVTDTEATERCFFTGLHQVILSILVDTFISKISFPMQPGPETVSYTHLTLPTT